MIGIIHIQRFIQRNSFFAQINIKLCGSKLSLFENIGIVEKKMISLLLNELWWYTSGNTPINNLLSMYTKSNLIHMVLVIESLFRVFMRYYQQTCKPSKIRFLYKHFRIFLNIFFFVSSICIWLPQVNQYT